MLCSLVFILIPIGLISGQSLNNLSIIRQSHPLSKSNFDEILVDGAFDVILTDLSSMKNATGIDSSASVDIETTMEIQNYISVDIIDGHTLAIVSHIPLFHQNQNPRVFIRFTRPLRRYTTTGSGSTVTDGNGLINLSNEKFILDKQGSSSVALQLNVNEFDALISGSGQVQLRGEVHRKSTFLLSSSAHIDALELISSQVKVEVLSSGSVKVKAIDGINIENSGSGKIFYELPSGKKPTQVVLSGSGNIVRL